MSFMAIQVLKITIFKSMKDFRIGTRHRERAGHSNSIIRILLYYETKKDDKNEIK